MGGGGWGDQYWGVSEDHWVEEDGKSRRGDHELLDSCLLTPKVLI